MAYFSNGSEGDRYEARWCARCVHGSDGGAGACPVWTIHLFHNGSTGAAEQIMNDLIPPGSPENGQCKMFVEGQQGDLLT